nr:MAG TPA: hypothetical protein [Caudoviricetes sp.]DAY63427.1 MAG TPA: hypothetical protein [Caudoviricetes sp.]
MRIFCKIKYFLASKRYNSYNFLNIYWWQFMITCRKRFNFFILYICFFIEIYFL